MRQRLSTVVVARSPYSVQTRASAIDDGQKEAESMGSVFMKRTVATISAVALLSGPLVAQERKPVPKDSVRVFVPGCTKGYIFTAGRRTEDQPGSLDVPPP